MAPHDNAALTQRRPLGRFVSRLLASESVRSRAGHRNGLRTPRLHLGFASKVLKCDAYPGSPFTLPAFDFDSTRDHQRSLCRDILTRLHQHVVSQRMAKCGFGFHRRQGCLWQGPFAVHRRQGCLRRRPLPLRQCGVAIRADQKPRLSQLSEALSQCSQEYPPSQMMRAAGTSEAPATCRSAGQDRSAVRNCPTKF
jgi:hypothetical protein